MRNHADGEVPLSGFARALAVDFTVFGQVFARSTVKYASFAVTAAKKVHFYLLSPCLKVKGAVLRLLMKRGSFFAPAPRLGLATVTSTTVFSMLLVPTFSSVQQGATSEVSDLLAQSTTTQDTEGLVAGTIIEGAEKDVREETLDYEVQSGDTLSTIGERFLVNTEALAYVNDLSSGAILHPGDTLKIPPSSGIDEEGSTLIHAVESGDTVSSIATKYEVAPQAIVDFNYLEEPYLLHAGDELYIPDASIPKPEPKPAVNYASAGSNSDSGGLSLAPVGDVSGTGGFRMPTAGTITQYMSWYHPAIDIADSCGTPVVAADSGTITFGRWWAGGGGNSVWINHGNGYITKYAHLSGFAKTSGVVQKGEVIGYMGATGRAYGCHLHFIVEKNGRAINPLSVL